MDKSTADDHLPTDLTKLEEAMDEDDQRKDLGKEGIAQNEMEGLEPRVTASHNTRQGAEAESNVTTFQLPNSDRPFQCGQCGVSFTQKGNLLRHIKLHSGEKPFKCPFCSYACRRRDALTGHLRTHSVGKPYNCTICGRSYKQRSSLEEHKDRCHSYQQSIDTNMLDIEPCKADANKRQTSVVEAISLVPFDRPAAIEKLQSSVGKRKSTVPQKFVDEKLVCYSYPALRYKADLKYEKEAELMQDHMMDQAINNAISYLGSNSLRPFVHHPTLSMADVVPIVTPLYTQMYPLGPRMEYPNRRTILPPPSFPLDSLSSINSPLSLAQPKSSLANREESLCNGGHESADSACNSPEDRPGNSSNRVPYLMSSPTLGKEEVQEVRPGCMDVSFDHCITRNAYRVFSREGQEMRTFKCEPCRALFLDHVMYTIHMGCHGYQNPLECNICGCRSRDRYEFSSHIIRGEHTFQ